MHGQTMSADKDSSAPLFRVIVAVAAVLAALHVGCISSLNRSRSWPRSPVAAHDSRVCGADGVCVAFLALGRHRALHDPASYWTGIAFAAFSIFGVFYVLSWPGLRSDGGRS